ncbi:MAG: hypothetical protein ACE5Q6_10205 [Dehalococcoidia bacterium]
MKPFNTLGPSRLSEQFKTSRPFLLLFALVLLLAVGVIACGTAATATPAPTPTPILEDKPAPIESVNIEVNPGTPSFAELVVVSGLPNACYTFKEHRLTREGKRFVVEIINVQEGGELVACAEIYGMVTTRIPLEGEIEVCQVYQVVANGKSFSVQAIAPNVRCADPSAQVAREIVLRVGEGVALDDRRLEITFLEVIQDSRCPSDVVCIRAGDATVRLSTSVPGHVPEEFSLLLGEEVGRPVKTLARYTVKLSRLDPYPVSTAPTSQGDYVAYLKVSQDRTREDAGY